MKDKIYSSKTLLYRSEMMAAYKKEISLPYLSDFDIVLTSDQAYQIQKHLVQEASENDAIIAYEAGMTSKGSQKKFGATQPLAAVRFASGLYFDTTEIKLSEFQNPILETEIGYRMKSAITKKVTLGSVKELVKEIIPMIEIPDIKHPDMSRLTQKDMIATNGAGAVIIQGKPMNPNVDINEEIITLALGEEEISRGKGSDAMGDQWTSLIWLINKTLDQGYPITSEHTLMTGTVGQIVPLTKGSYTALYGSLGMIKFIVV